MSCFLRAHSAAVRGCGRLLWPVVVAGMLSFSGLASRAEDIAADARPDPETLITSYGEYWKEGVRRDERPIRAEIVVTYFDPTWRNFWGQIDGEPGYMFSRSRFPITFGDRVLVEGTVIPWRGLEEHRVKVTVLERGVPIQPIDARGQLSKSDALNTRVVTLEAILDQQIISGDDGDHLDLKLVAEGHRIHAFQWSENARLLEVPQGTILRLTGLYVSKEDPRTESTEIDLWISQPHAIVPVGHVASDPGFALPLTRIGDLPRVAFGSKPHAHIAGFVREYHPGVSLTLRDETGQITVRNLQTLPLQIGDIVEATGDPFIRTSDWLLRDALVRRATPEAVARLTEAPANPTKLRIASQVLDLTSEAAAEGRAVEMYGIVTWCSQSADTMVIRDSSGGVLVHLNGATDVPPKIGLGMRLSGVTVTGPYASEIKATRFEPWGVALLPEPRAITLEQATSGLYQGQRVEMRGHVKQVQTDDQWTRLTLGVGKSEFMVRIDRDETADRFSGSMVAVRGVCQAQANSRRQLTGIELWTHGVEEIRVEQAAPTDPFAVGLRQISSLRQFNSNAAQERWARVRGVVTHHVAGRLLFVQDGAEGILIFPKPGAAIVPGDVVEATGLPGLEDHRLVLREAVYRKIDHAEEPAPIVVQQPREVSDIFESRLVHIQGRLINCAADPEAVALAVQAQDIVFPAFLPRTQSALDLTTLPMGAELSLTGVYEVLRDERRKPIGLRLQLRSPADIVVTARPSWWTPARLLVVTGALAACIAIVSTWSMLLRGRVRAQTAQIRAQLAKEANLEAHNRDIVADASDTIFTTDLTGKFTSFNPAGERMTGFSCTEALGMSLRDLVVPEDAAPLGARLDALRNGEATVTFQSRFRRRDGGTVWGEASLRLRREGDQPTGVLGVVRDVSERKRVEEELRRARDAAEANTQAKSAFLANMSHEIRTPMNAVIGMSNLLLDTRLDEEQREFACTIRNGAESLLTVLNDILDFSRIEAGKLQFESVEFDLAETIDHTLELLAPRALSKQLELSGFLPPVLPEKVRGDPGRLRQVLLNLLGNAVKFTERGEVTLTASLVQRDANNVTMRFDVRDTGIGMTPETLARLFQPFSQADASMARKFGGAGLGLAISKQIVELLGGTIGAESEAGRGSRFWFTLPLQLIAAGPVSALAAAEAFRGVRVLAVDDHATNRRIVRHHTKAWGMRCDVVADAASVLTQLRAAAAGNDPYRVLISDCAMPGMDGLALARQIQDDAHVRGLPIVLLTSLDRKIAPEETAALGIAVVLNKPLRVPELFAAIARVLGVAAPRLQARAPKVELPRAEAPVPALRVLVAEDNVTNQRLVALQLGKLGCKVDLANHGLEVLEALERAEYDVVFMDCQMPEMDGFETTRRIRGSRSYGRVRVVAMTANAMVGDRDRCLAAGMDEYLSKPVRPDDLKGALSRAAQSTVTTYS